MVMLSTPLLLSNFQATAAVPRVQNHKSLITIYASITHLPCRGFLYLSVILEHSKLSCVQSTNLPRRSKKTSNESFKIAGTELVFGVLWEENAAPFDTGCCFVQGIGTGKGNKSNILQYVAYLAQTLQFV